MAWSRLGGVQLWGGANVPSQMPGPASRLYAQNVLNVIMLMTRDGAFDPDFDDEIVAAMCVTHAGEETETAMSEAVRLADHLRAGDLRRRRGDHQGLLDLAHAADVGGERDPRRDLGRGDPGGGFADSTPILVLGLVAVALATINMVGGFVVTDRMLHMFRPRRRGSRRAAAGAGPVTPVWAQLGYLAAAICFVVALKGLSSPKTARRGQPDRRRRAPCSPA